MNERLAEQFQVGFGLWLLFSQLANKHCRILRSFLPDARQRQMLLDPAGWQWNLFRLTCCCRFSEQDWCCSEAGLEVGMGRNSVLMSNVY